MRHSFLLLLATILIVSCKNTKSNQISLRLDWTTNMSFAGDIVAQNLFDSEENIEIESFQAGEGIDPIRLVISGQDQIGITTFDKMLAANEKGADLVAIGFINNVSPTVFLTLENKEFKKPSDFLGKSVGIMPGGSTEFVYRGFVSELELDGSKIEEIPASFDLQGFINNQYDIKLAFIYVENIALDSQGIEYNMIQPRDFGVNFPGRVYFAKREWLNKNTEKAQAFVNSIIKGWDYAFKNKEKSVELLYDFDNSINREVELKSFPKAYSYFNGFNEQYLMVDESKLDGMARLLEETKLIKDANNYKTFVNLDFVKNFYHKK
jgi:ABC-type nitrate/sulfonate/bicarbonate transport system substrate-binding protein